VCIQGHGRRRARRLIRADRLAASTKSPVPSCRSCRPRLESMVLDAACQARHRRRPEYCGGRSRAPPSLAWFAGAALSLNPAASSKRGDLAGSSSIRIACVCGGVAVRPASALRCPSPAVRAGGSTPRKRQAITHRAGCWPGGHANQRHVREGRSVSGCTTAALTDTCAASALSRYFVHAPCSLGDGRAIGD
jgi:hypothetical protein